MEGEEGGVFSVYGNDICLMSRLKKERRRKRAQKRLYVCDTCGRSFGYKSNLSRHMMLHTGEKPHVCAVCSRAFRAKREMSDHILQHTGEKPYCCTYCDLCFTTRRHKKATLIRYIEISPHYVAVVRGGGNRRNVF